MKKGLLCLVTVALSVMTVSAQRKGDMYVGGMLGVSTTSITEGTTQTTVGIAPEFGSFVTDRLRIGGSLAYQLSSNDGFTVHALTVGPTLAYYVKLCDRFFYTPEVAVGFALASAEGTTGYGIAAGVSLGAFEFQPSPRWGVAVNLLSLSYSYLSSSGVSASSVTFQLGINPSVGVRYYF